MADTKIKTKSTAAAVRAVAQSSAAHRKARENTRIVRNKLDKAMLAAKDAGATYREIAEAAEVSTAWVQSSLERCGYTTTPR